MTKEEAISILLELDFDDHKDLCNIHYYEGSGELRNTALDIAIQALLERESILDKIYIDIQRLRGCSCGCSDGIIDDVEDIIDKYKESEGYHDK